MVNLRIARILAALWAGALALACAQEAAASCADLLPQPRTQSEKSRVIDPLDLVRLRQVGQSQPNFGGASALSVSPDGQQLAFVISRADPATNTYCIGLSVMSLKSSGAPRLLDQGGQIILTRIGNRGRIWDIGLPALVIPLWSPDGKSIAYLRRDNNLTQLWVADVRTGSARQATDSSLDVEKFVWRPDGGALIYGVRTGQLSERQSLSKEALSGYHYDDRFVPIMSSRPLPDATIPLAAYSVEFFTWKTAPATSAETGILPPDDISDIPKPLPVKNEKGWIAGILRDEHDPRRSASLAATLPTGQRILCAKIVCKSGLGGMWWSPNGGPLIFLRREGWSNGEYVLYRWQPGFDDPHPILRTTDLISNCVFAEGRLVCLREAASAPQRITSIDTITGGAHDLFDPNPEYRAIRFGKVTRLRWRNDDGLEVRGELVLPPGYTSGNRLPLIVTTYTSDGFLRGATGDEYPVHAFAAKGFAVLSYSHPKSSIEWDGDPAKVWAARFSKNSAVLAGVKLVIDMGVADPSRVGISGLSDGSTTSEFAIVNSSVFAAASVSSCCMESTTVNILSGPVFAETLRKLGFAGRTALNSQGFWTTGSIVDNAAKISAPLLIQQADHEYLLALDAYNALREQGKPVDLYVFPDAYHHKWQPAQRLAVYKRNIQWFDFWLRGREDPNPVDPDQYQRWRAMRQKPKLEK